ncbi:MAG: helix-turn-helix domain-containing protein, partial [Gammaproteobacteria bacterium]|nr:helix-turn-helix domain-containing protein [Gammaproteobacteria bacterium]
MKAFKYRIYPTKSQQEVLEGEFGAVRWAYNYYLAANRDLRAIKERRM